jgi:hypothetical protein
MIHPRLQAGVELQLDAYRAGKEKKAAENTPLEPTIENQTGFFRGAAGTPAADPSDDQLRRLHQMDATIEKIEEDFQAGLIDEAGAMKRFNMGSLFSRVVADKLEDSDEWNFALAEDVSAAYRAGADDPSDDRDATIEKIEDDFHAGLIDEAEAMKRYNMAMYGDPGKWAEEKKASWTDIGIAGYLQGYLPKTAAKKPTLTAEETEG